MGTFILYFVWQFRSICHHWMFPTIRNITFPQHDIFLVCLSNYYHYLPDISLLLRYWFGLGHPLFSVSVLSASNAYLLSWLAIFIYVSKTWRSLCFQPSSPSFFSQHLQVQYLKNLHHFSRKTCFFTDIFLISCCSNKKVWQHRWFFLLLLWLDPINSHTPQCIYWGLTWCQVLEIK